MISTCYASHQHKASGPGPGSVAVRSPPNSHTIAAPDTRSQRILQSQQDTDWETDMHVAPANQTHRHLYCGLRRTSNAKKKTEEKLSTSVLIVTLNCTPKQNKTP
ncbi:hypothetical protein SRHO_G00064750 [Serrasalmus rhombeus]